MSSLLDPDFLRRLSRLQVLARRKFAGAAGGGRRSTRRGSSAEFADHRPYYPGDDVRRIDWNAYARLEELVLRLFVAEEDLTLYLMVDKSRSLAIGEPSKIDVAKRCAAAVGYVALSGSDRVSVVPYASRVETPMAPTRGKRRIGALMRYLDALDCEGETDLSQVVDEFLSRRPKPGLVVLFTDLLDPGGYQRPIDRLLGERHEPAIFHILSKEELRPTPGGDLVLVDSERSVEIEASIDDRAIRAYLARLRSFLEGVESYTRRRGISYVRAGGDISFEDALLAYLRAA
ncbi:MAG: DUF58 domain-containing protein [Myxococcota bacterium]